MPSTKLLSMMLALLPSPSLGYSTSSGRPYVRPFVLETEATKVQLPNNRPRILKDAETPKKMHYNLGLGKNRPVHPFILQADESRGPTNDLAAWENSQHSETDPIFSSTKYLMEHDATREFPSPLSESRSIHASQKQNLPKVQPRRKTRDVLAIENVFLEPTRARHPSSSEKVLSTDMLNHSLYEVPLRDISPALPSIRAISSEPLDLNTIWVEMMLHSEQMKTLAPQNNLNSG